MRQDRIFARILLIFSIANVVLAAPAFIRQRALITDVQDDQSTDGSMPSLETASDMSETPAGPDWVLQEPPQSQSGPLHVSTSGSEQYWTPMSSPGSLHQNGVEPATPPSPPAGLHQDGTSSQASSSPQLHDDPRPGSDTPQLHDDAPAGPGAQPLFSDPPWWKNYRTDPEIEEAPPTHLVEAPGRWPSFGPGWQGTFIRVADAYVKETEAKEAEAKEAAVKEAAVKEAEAEEAVTEETEAKVKPPKGFCGLRCWKLFPRSFEWSAEKDHGRRFS